MPGRGEAMVALEGATELSSDGGRKRETQRAEPALSPTSQKAPIRNPGRSRAESCEGNHSKVFSTALAVVLAATRDLTGSGARPTSGSVRARAGGPWNESGNASDAGAGLCNSSSGRPEQQDARI